MINVVVSILLALGTAFSLTGCKEDDSAARLQAQIDELQAQLTQAIEKIEELEVEKANLNDEVLALEEEREGLKQEIIELKNKDNQLFYEVEYQRELNTYLSVDEIKKIIHNYNELADFKELDLSADYQEDDFLEYSLVVYIFNCPTSGGRVIDVGISKNGTQLQLKVDYNVGVMDALSAMAIVVKMEKNDILNVDNFEAQVTKVTL